MMTNRFQDDSKTRFLRSHFFAFTTRRLGIFLLVVWLPSLGYSIEPDPDHREPIDLVDFRLSHVLPFFEGGSNARIRSRVYLGVDATYQWYLTRMLGVVLDSGAWFVPIQIRGQSARLASGHLRTGFVFQPFPETWFSPALFGLAGGALIDVSELRKIQWAYPLGSRLSVNLFRESDMFRDTTLALTLSGGISYYLNSYDFLKPWLIDLGIGLRGSF